jgi:septum formation protein
VVHYDGQIREKPQSEEECRAYLKSYETAPAVTVSSVVVTHAATGTQREGVDVARQWFRPIPEEVVGQLLAKGDVMYCCGGFLIDDPLIEPYLAAREGDADSIIGLPLRLTRQLIQEVEDAVAAGSR